ncbi:MAG: tetratricopeptide repeat protein, partial [Planctomycetes bacterium]|nr:tetratricopeptide repeat protein [Planctomycetota bacterium]
MTPDAELIAAIGFLELVADQRVAVRELLDRHADLVARHPELLILRANSYRLEGRYDESNALDASIPPSTTPTGHFIRGVKAILQSHSGAQEPAQAAVTHLRHAIALESPARALHLAELVHAATHAADYDLADRAADALIKRWPDRYATWFWRGFSLRSRNPSIALKAYERALELDADADACRLSIAECHLLMGDHDSAQRIVQEVLANHPELPQAHLLLDRIYKELNEVYDAHDAILDHLERSRRSVVGLLLLAELLDLQGRPIEAADVARRYIEAGGNRSLGFLGHLARLDLEAGHFEESLALQIEAHATGMHPTIDAIGQSQALIALGSIRAAAFVIETQLASDTPSPSDQLQLAAARDAIDRENSRLETIASTTAAATSFSDRVRLVVAQLESDDQDGARRTLGTWFEDAESAFVSPYELMRLATLLASCSDGPDGTRAERARRLMHRVLD